MAQRSNGRFGMTSRSSPVNDMAQILYPNGYDRTRNRSRPLVTVHDTATEENNAGTHLPDDEFQSGSPSENVTVTIRIGADGDGIVTETDKKGVFTREEIKYVSCGVTPRPHEDENINTMRERLLGVHTHSADNPSSTEASCLEGVETPDDFSQTDFTDREEPAKVSRDQHSTDIALHIDQQNSKQTRQKDNRTMQVNSSEYRQDMVQETIGACGVTDHDSPRDFDNYSPETLTKDCHVSPEAHEAVSTQNSLYEEYERFIAPVEISNNRNDQCHKTNSIATDKCVKPKVTIIRCEDDGNSSNSDCVDMNYMSRQPNEGGHEDVEEPEDFRHYLKSIRRESSRNGDDYDSDVTKEEVHEASTTVNPKVKMRSTNNEDKTYACHQNGHCEIVDFTHNSDTYVMTGVVEVEPNDIEEVEEVEVEPVQYIDDNSFTSQSPIDLKNTPVLQSDEPIVINISNEENFSDNDKTQENRPCKLQIIEITDDEEDSEELGLLGFDFQLLDKSNKEFACGELKDIAYPGDETMVENRSTIRANNRRRTNENSSVTENANSESEDDDDKAEEDSDCSGNNQCARKDDRDDDNNNDNSRRGNNGQNGNTNNGGDGNNGDHGQDNNRDGNHDNTGNDNNENNGDSSGTSSGGQFSPGMRSRSSQGQESCKNANVCGEDNTFNYIDSENANACRSADHCNHKDNTCTKTGERALVKSDVCTCSPITHHMTMCKSKLDTSLAGVSEQHLGISVTQETKSCQPIIDHGKTYIYPCVLLTEQTYTCSDDASVVYIQSPRGSDIEDFECVQGAYALSPIDDDLFMLMDELMDEHMSPEDQEVFEILDFTECLNNVECQFQAIDKYEVDEVESEPETSIDVSQSENDSYLSLEFLSPQDAFEDNVRKSLASDVDIQLPPLELGTESELKTWTCMDLLTSNLFNGSSIESGSCTSLPASVSKHHNAMVLSDFSDSASSSGRSSRASITTCSNYEDEFDKAMETIDSQVCDYSDTEISLEVFGDNIVSQNQVIKFLKEDKSGQEMHSNTLAVLELRTFLPDDTKPNLDSPTQAHLDEKEFVVMIDSDQEAPTQLLDSKNPLEDNDCNSADKQTFLKVNEDIYKDFFSVSDVKENSSFDDDKDMCSEKSEDEERCSIDSLEADDDVGTKLHPDITGANKYKEKTTPLILQRHFRRQIDYDVPILVKAMPIQVIDLQKKLVFKKVCKLKKLLITGDAALKKQIQKLQLNSSQNEIVEEDDVNIYSALEDLKRKWDMYDGSHVANSDDNPGGIMQLGSGFYIFGTGSGLNLPVGPRLKQKESNKNIPRRSCYFRGVPGIINHAYKMSQDCSTPKLATPKDSSPSRRILHACNRLATQPALTFQCIRNRQDAKHSMTPGSYVTEDDADDNSNTCFELGDMLTSARDLMNSSRFDEAEAMFLKLYNEIQEKPEDNGRLLVETLTGLADICIRRSRMCRSNPLEWQWLCMHAIALLQYTVEFCESELESQLDNEATEWYHEQKQASELKCRPLEDAFTRALYNSMKHESNAFDPFQSFSLPNTPVTQTDRIKQRKANLFPLSSTVPQYLLVPGMSYRVTDKGLSKHSADDSEVAVDWLAKFEFYCKDRLQTKDHKCVTEKVLRSASTTTADDDTESMMSEKSENSHGSLDWDHSDLRGIEELELDNAEVGSPSNDYSWELELASSDTENEGWDFFLHQRRNCDFQSVVQVTDKPEKSDTCETEKDITGLCTKELRDIYQQEKRERRHRKRSEARDIISPLHAHSISLTLARSFCRLADKLVQEEEYKKAEMVYEKILDIIDAIQDGTAGMLRFSARIMKNLGTVKSKQGKSSSGLVLLNKALNTYKDLQDEEANFEIAVALIELGNGYIVGKNHEDSVFEDVIVAICDFFEKDASDSQSTSNSSSVQSHISQMTSSLTSSSEERNVEEAVTCYTEAITLLDCYEADEKQTDMFAKAVMRLGDCHFMQKDYDKALECYEKALGMFRSNNIFGRDSLMENAHVLCMLGVSSFMLHVYPRAASVFETALHMVRCAYGFKRTFLNGMLQSLCGITYYKMKNYHKCVSMCYQGYETYCELFGDVMPRLDKQKFWLVCQTLYVMGNSYNILSLQQKAMKYLSIARSLMKSSKSRERRQFMRVLQILGDCYFAQYDYKTALQFYNEALEYGECESSISFDEVFDPNCASDEMTIHNHLVSKSAEAHLSMQQYQNAVHYLEQAHDMQEVMGEDIKGDLIHTLHQLGHMHSAAGDVNKAIESYKDCLEVFREIHQGELGPEICTTLGNLAAICYVKACIAEDDREENAMTEAAQTYFHDALSLENNAEVCVKYGNFLYTHCRFEEAIIQLRNALHNDNITAHIVYRGLEKITLPELLQDEVDTHEEICLPSSCLARYLLILSHKAIGEMDEAELNLICLMEEVIDYDVPLLYSLLGYALMELTLFEEAAETFLLATETEGVYQLAVENYCICMMIILQRMLLNAFENIWEYLCQILKPIR